jgi:cardiolipin synthase
MGLPNWLTILRIVLIPVFVSLLVYRRPGIALSVFCLASLTDLLDGYVARRRGSQSRLGAFLDPMADKALLTASYVTLTYLHAIPFWITAVVISRDAILVLGAALIHITGGRIYPSPTLAGKLSTFFQIMTVLLAMLVPYIGAALVLKAFIWVTAGFAVFSGLQYITRGMGYLNGAPAAEREHEDTLRR